MCAGVSPAARADVVDAQRLHLQRVVGHYLRRPVVVDLLGRGLVLRQARVGLGDQEDVGRLDRRHLADHALDLAGAVAAVGAQDAHAHVVQRLHRLHRLDAHHRAEMGVEGHGDRDRQAGRRPDPLHRGLDFFQRAHRLDQEEVHPALGQRGRLLGERVAHFVRHACAEREEDLARRPHVARDQHVVIGRGGHLARRLDGRQVELSHAILEIVQPQAEAVAPERVGRDHLRAGIRVGLVDALEHLRPGDVPLLRRPARGEPRRLQHRAHRAVAEDDWMGAEELNQLIHFMPPCRRATCYVLRDHPISSAVLTSSRHHVFTLPAPPSPAPPRPPPPRPGNSGRRGHPRRRPG